MANDHDWLFYPGPICIWRKAYFLFFGWSATSEFKSRLPFCFVLHVDLELMLSVAGNIRGGGGGKLTICVRTHKTSSTATRNSSIWPVPWTWWPHHANATITKNNPFGPVQPMDNQSAVVKIHMREGPNIQVRFPSLWLHTFPPGCPCQRILIILLDRWNYLELATPL